MAVLETRALPDGRRLAERPWADHLCHRLLAWSAPRMIEALSPFDLKLVFLGGSAALGEAVGWEDPAGGGHLLSDLDLGAVTEHVVPGDRRARLLGELNSTGSPFPHATIGRPFTIGFYERRYWDRCTPTLGLVDLKAFGFALWGDAALLNRLPAPETDRIRQREAFRLVGNRALELLLAPSPAASPEARARFLHALAKASTGLWTARLVLEGRYRPRWSERAALLPERPRSAVERAAAAWSPFLREPGEDRLPPAAERIPLYREGLSEWLAGLGEGWLEPGEPPELIFAREPAGIRDRARAWKHAEFGGRPASPVRFRPADLLRCMEFTPEGRRLALAVLYWRLLPEGAERAEERSTEERGANGRSAEERSAEERSAEERSAGDRSANGRCADEWRAATKRLLGFSLPGGSGSRKALTRLLGSSEADPEGERG